MPTGKYWSHCGPNLVACFWSITLRILFILSTMSLHCVVVDCGIKLCDSNKLHTSCITQAAPPPNLTTMLQEHPPLAAPLQQAIWQFEWLLVWDWEHKRSLGAVPLPYQHHWTGPGTTGWLYDPVGLHLLNDLSYFLMDSKGDLTNRLALRCRQTVQYQCASLPSQFLLALSDSN